MKSICAVFLCLGAAHAQECLFPCLPWGVNASAAVDLNPCAWDVFVKSSFLYWEARQEGLNAGVNQPSSPSAFTPNIGGSLTEHHFEYNPAFELGIQFQSHFDCWDFKVNYLWYHHETSHFSPRPSAIGSMQPEWIQFTLVTGGIIATSANTEWKLAMDVIDVEAGRKEWVGKKLTLRPHADLRLLHIDQRFDINYGLVSGGQNFSINKTSSWGVGPRVGLEGDWDILCGFRFEGDAAFSLLWQGYEFGHKEYVVPASAGGGALSNYRVHTHDSFLRPVLELAMGFGWSRTFCSDRFYIDLSAQYALNTWWNQNMMWTFVNDFGINDVGMPRSNLYLHGLTLSAAFGF